MWGWNHQIWEKIREPPNVTKVRSHVILVLHNVRMVLSNVRMVLSNVRKNKGITECDKRTVTCDVSITKCEDGTIKCEKKIREPPNVTKVQSHVMLVLHNVRMVSSHVMFWQTGIASCLVVVCTPKKKRRVW